MLVLLLVLVACSTSCASVRVPLAISSPVHGDAQQGEAGWAGIHPQVLSGQTSNG